RRPGYPSAYLLVRIEPCASRTARLTTFSEAISSRLFCWRSASARIAFQISGSTCCSGLLIRSLLFVAFDVVHHVLDGADFLRLLVGNLHVVFFFERHHELDDVERIGAQILDERGFRRDVTFADAQLFADDLPDLGFDS